MQKSSRYLPYPSHEKLKVIIVMKMHTRLGASITLSVAQTNDQRYRTKRAHVDARCKLIDYKSDPIFYFIYPLLVVRGAFFTILVFSLVFT